MPSLAAPGLGSSRRGRRWRLILLAAAAGVSAYGAYKFYHLPSIARRRKELARIAGALISVADAASSSVEAISLVSSDLSRFLWSGSSEVPSSFRQIAKLAGSLEFSAAISSASEAVAAGIVRGLRSAELTAGKVESLEPESRIGSATTFLECFLDKFFSSAGSGFAAEVTGSFARELSSSLISSTDLFRRSDESSAPRWVAILRDDKTCKELAEHFIDRIVGAAAAAYLDRRTKTNAVDDLFTGLTNPMHEAKMKDVLVAVGNGAVETLVRTWHTVRSDHRTTPLQDNRRLLQPVPMEARDVHVIREVMERGQQVVRYAGAKTMAIMTVCLALCMEISIGTKKLMMPAPAA
ncbi:protein PHLOEM PROTEIN 2-LIKE A10-like [Curcuma longa]|uniref:protein PHLOEM PROTEIN 2-LIKE A10-like n=1 Tax=Curcuma longa TaxID=136217 RepID=UPI003D9E41C9